VDDARTVHVDQHDPYRVTFVCTGNICRSPIAEVVVADALRREGLDDRVVVDSAGTGGWHVGHGADPRAVAALQTAGLDGTAHRAREVDRDALGTTDLVVALDSGHLRDLRRLVPGRADRVRLLRSFDPGADGTDVADPYYGDDAGFTTTVEQVRAAVPGLLAHVRAELDGRVTAP
jgi:protein-tyrosine phosphatase